MTEYIDSTDEKSKEVRRTPVFKKMINSDLSTEEPNLVCPGHYDFVELIRRRDSEYTFDLMVAYDKGYKGISEGWYLGDWNNPIQK